MNLTRKGKRAKNVLLTAHAATTNHTASRQAANRRTMYLHNQRCCCANNCAFVDCCYTLPGAWPAFTCHPKSGKKLWVFRASLSLLAFTELSALTVAGGTLATHFVALLQNAQTALSNDRYASLIDACNVYTRLSLGGHVAEKVRSVCVCLCAQQKFAALN